MSDPGAAYIDFGTYDLDDYFLPNTLFVPFDGKAQAQARAGRVKKSRLTASILFNDMTRHCLKVRR